MKVFCRFAPPYGGSSATVDAHINDALTLRADGPPIAASSVTGASVAASAVTGTRVHLADPVTLSKAAFSCDGVFLPPSAGHRRDSVSSGNVNVGHDGDAVQQQQQQQELLYTSTCKGVLRAADTPVTAAADGRRVARRRIYLAYGQTASGKTYSLFGPAPSSRRAAAATADALPPAAGVVPRFLHDVFHDPHRVSSSPPCTAARSGHASHHAASDVERDGSVFVDVSCFEVYNEVTTDLVALSTTLAAGCGQAAFGAAGPRTSSSTAAGLSSRRGVASVPCLDVQQEQAPVWVAHNLYRDATEDGGDDGCCSVKNSVSSCHSPRGGVASASSQASQEEYGSGAVPFVKTEYRATEKQQVLRCVERARCKSFAAAHAVLHALLTLRQECATSRNQSSSRGHLVFRVETYEADGCGGQWVLRHEIAFVDLAGSESGRLTDAPVAATATAAERGDGASNEPFMSSGAACGQAPPRRCRGRSSGPPSVNSSFVAAAATSRASSQHSRTSHDSSAHSAASSHHSSHNSSGSIAAYHRYLLHPPQAEDERALRTRRQRETRCINASLLALRKVFRALYEATQLTKAYAASLAKSTAAAAGLRRPPLHHAPFKDSALTAILEPFLLPQPTLLTSPSSQSGITADGQLEGGSSDAGLSAVAAHVVLLVCCSSRSVDFFETVASLRLGAEATAVNPEVVLRALPVQRREQQQQQLHALKAQCLGNGNSSSGGRLPRASSAGPQRLFRSASAPNQRLLLHATPTPAPHADTSVGLRIGTHAATAAPQITTAASAALTSSSSTRNGGQPTAEDSVRLQEEVQRYKTTAQQLYKQCKSLCESYDECVEELGKCRTALTAKDARIAELERQLAAATATGSTAKDGSSLVHLDPPPPITQIVKTNMSRREKPDGVAAPHTPAREAPAELAEGSSSPAARSPGSATPAHRAKRQQPQQQLQLQQRVKSEGRGGVVRTSGSRGMSNSTAREESARCLVSVSPFSTASLMTGNARRSAAPEEEEEEEEEEGEDAGRVMEEDGAQRDKKNESRVAEQPAALHTHTSPAATATQETAHDGVRQALLRSGQQQQLLKARSIMDTLLARQIFPPTTTSPARENSPSPVLPTLSAHSTVLHSTAAAAAAVSAQVEVRCSPQDKGCSAVHAGPPPPHRPLAALPTNAASRSSPSCLSCGAARGDSSEEGRRCTRNATRGVEEDTLQLLPQRHVDTPPGEHPGQMSAAAAAAFAKEPEEATLEVNSTPPQTAASVAMKTTSSPPADTSDGADVEDAVEEIVISYRGSPSSAHVTATANSEGSTRRSKSTVYTALMPPSPSRSPASSRSPSLHESLPNTYDVYQL